MKFVSGLLFICSFNLFAMTNKDPDKIDISVSHIIKSSCGKSGYFNPVVCESEVMECYDKFYWPKTVSVELKLTVLEDCVSVFIRR